MARLSFTVAALVLAALVSLVAASTVPHTMWYGKVPSGSDWARQGRVAHDVEHRLAFAVKMRANAAETCDSTLMAISTPNSPRFGEHLSLEQVGALLADRDNTRTVENWLAENNLAYETSPNGDWISVKASVAALEQLLGGAQFHTYHSASAERSIYRVEALSIPTKIARAVDFIGNTLSFPIFKADYAFIRPASPRASGTITPQDIYKFYGVKNHTAGAGVTQSLFEALGQDFAPDDLKRFQRQFGLKANPVKTVIGDNDPSQCVNNPNTCAEANLDVQYMMAMAEKAETWYWSISTEVQDPFLEWIQELAKREKIPSVHSISYGSIAKEDAEYDIERFNVEACKLGLRGVTIAVSSGDDGVANFQARGNPDMCGFSPSFPATSAYVTAVGATQGPEFGKKEIACTSDAGGLITTGGGFSIYIARPEWQDKAVKTYLLTPNLPPSDGNYNVSNRGYPDVSMLGHNYVVVIGGQSYQLSGTSASSPVFAGFVTLANAQRVAAGKKPIGFLNPLLYSAPAGIFNDITQGTNNCCAGDGSQITCCEYGFPATHGWDPVTGLGSVNYEPFAAYLAQQA